MPSLRTLLLAVLILGGPARTAITTIDNPGGGRIIAGDLSAADTSTRVALIDVLRRTHAYFGARPAVGRFLVTQDGTTALAFFQVSAQGTAVKGLALARVAPGAGAQGAILFDRAARFPTTLPPMLHRLEALAAHTTPTPAGDVAAPLPPEAAPPAPAGADPVQAGPIEAGPIQAGPAHSAPALSRERFPDGSGSVGVPAGWHLHPLGQGNYVMIRPGTPYFLAQGLQFMPMTPGSPVARMMARFKPRGGPPPIFAAYDPDPVRALFAVMRALPGNARIQLLRVLAEKQLGTVPASTLWAMALVIRDRNGVPVRINARAFLGRPFPNGGWMLRLTFYAAAPDAVFAATLPTFRAIQHSVRLNMAVIQRETAAGYQQFENGLHARQRQFEANLHAQNRAYQANLARNEAGIQAGQDASHAAARAYIRSLQGVGVVVDTQTGRHYEAPTGFVGAVSGPNPGRFQAVPLGSYIKGEDY